MNTKKGQTLLELVIGFLLVSVIITIAFQSLANISQNKPITRERQGLMTLAGQGVEISYNLSLSEWEVFKNLDGDFYPILENTTPSKKRYKLIPGEENLTGGISRKINIQKAKRDDSGNIDENGTPDPDTLKVTSIAKGEKTEVILEIYLMDINSIDNL